MTEKKIRVLMICLTRRGGLLHFNDCLADSLSKICDVRLICAENAEPAGQGISTITINVFP